MTYRPLYKLQKLASAEVTSLLSDGYRWVADLSNHRKESYYAFLRHPANGNRACIRITNGEGCVMINGKIKKAF